MRWHRGTVAIARRLACSLEIAASPFSMHVRNKVGMLFVSGVARLLSLRTQLFSSREPCCVECCSTPVARRPATRHVQLRWPHHPSEGRKRLARVKRSTFGEAQRQTDRRTPSANLRGFGLIEAKRSKLPASQPHQWRLITYTEACLTD